MCDCNLDSDKNSFTMVKAIVTFAKELNIKTVAEYIHNKKVFDVAKELGVDEFQGFYFSEPKKEAVSKTFQNDSP